MNRLVVYLSLLLFSCATQRFFITDKHYQGDPQYKSLGIMAGENYWVELIDDTETTFPFDESYWKSKENGTIDFYDVVIDGKVYRFGWNINKKKFIELKILDVNPFQYAYIVFDQKRVPR